LGISWEKASRGPVALYEVDLPGFTTIMRLNETEAARLKARPVARHKARSPENTRNKAVDAPEGLSESPVDLWSLTNRQLAEMAAERGLDVPKRPNKAQLVALLDG